MDDLEELAHPMFDPEMTDLIATHRELHKDAMTSFIQSIAIEDVVGAIDFYTEMYADSLILFGLIAELQEDNDPHGEWAEMVVSEFEKRNDLALDYLHDYLAQKGLKIDTAKTADEIKAQGASRKLEQAEAQFNAWKAKRDEQ